MSEEDKIEQNTNNKSQTEQSNPIIRNPLKPNFDPKNPDCRKCTNITCLIFCDKK